MLTFLPAAYAALAPFNRPTWTVRERPRIVLAVSMAVGGGSHLMSPLPIGENR
jgi:hypothetical protein